MCQRRSRWGGFSMRLYDDLAQQTMTLALQGHEMTLYVCGITPYDTTHLGHASNLHGLLTSWCAIWSGRVTPCATVRM